AGVSYSPNPTPNGGHTLKLCITNLESILAQLGLTSVEIAGLQGSLLASSAFDGLGQDGTSPFVLQPINEIDVSKIPNFPTVCAGTYENFVHVSGGDVCSTAPLAQADTTATVRCGGPQLQCSGGTLTCTALTAQTCVNVLNSAEAPGAITYSWSGAGLVTGGDQACATW